MIKLFVAGSRNDYRYPDMGYSNWMGRVEFTTNLNHADLVLGLGGADVSAKYYNQEDCGALSCQPYVDAFEYYHYKRAIEAGKQIIGICKGSQWAAALAGGAIFQHVKHPYYHTATTITGKTLCINSTHHNMADLRKLKSGEDYKLIAWADKLSPYHYDGNGDDNECNKEPEIVFYPKIKFLGIQFHPEMLHFMGEYPDTVKFCQKLLSDFLNHKI